MRISRESLRFNRTERAFLVKIVSPICVIYGKVIMIHEKESFEQDALKKMGGWTMSKVILLNGSAHRKGCTAAALDEMIKVFERVPHIERERRNSDD